MSQNRIIDHFIHNGNQWETGSFLKMGFGCYQSLNRMFDMTERRFDGNNTYYRLKTDVLNELLEARGL